MADFKDRILGDDGNARYNLVRENGTIIESNVEFVLSSPIIQDGDKFGARETNTLLELIDNSVKVRDNIANDNVIGTRTVENPDETSGTFSGLFTSIINRIVNAIRFRGVPTGSVFYFASLSSVPYGYLVCNGNEISRTTYLELFSVIGLTYGSGNGTTTFNLPDLRAEFIRGIDLGRGIDPNRQIGSSQDGSLFRKSNDNNYDLSTVLNGKEEIKVTGEWTAIQGSSSSRLGENFKVRPRNVALLPCIKY